MVVTINSSKPHDKVGPGLQINLQSTFTPFPTGGTWTVQFAQTVTPFTQIWTEVFPAAAPVGNFTIGTKYRETPQASTNYDFASDDGVTVSALLRDSGGALKDFASTTTTWEGREGVGRLVALQTGIGTGLTATQATELQDTKDNSVTALSNWDTFTGVTLPSLQDLLNAIITNVTATITTTTGAVSTTLGELFSGKLLDMITTVNLSGGETCDPVDADLSGGSVQGIVVHVTTYPDAWNFTTPDQAWSVKDLAVVTLTRGGNIVMRHGVHTVTHEIYPLPGIPLFPILLSTPIIPGDYHVHVDWAFGVCGEVIALQFP